MDIWYWAFTDNFEWHKSFEPEGKFGLFSINRDGREIFSERKVHDAFLVGGRGDDIINPGILTPGSTCKIDNVILILQDKDRNPLATTSKGERDAISPFPPYVSKFGARIVDSHEGTTNMEVKVHWFFDIGTAVRYQILYLLSGDDCNNDGLDLDRTPTKGAFVMREIITNSENGRPTQSAIDNATIRYGTIASDGSSVQTPFNPCKGVSDEIELLKEDIRNVQDDLRQAATNQKSQLVEMIRALLDEVTEKQIELNQCLNNIPPIPPILG